MQRKSKIHKKRPTKTSKTQALKKMPPRPTGSASAAVADIQAEQRFWELLQAAPDGILEVDRDGKIQLVNSAVEKLFGYQRDELLGQPVEVLVPTESRGMHSGHRANYWSHPGTRPMGSGLQLNAARKDGTTFPV